MNKQNNQLSEYRLTPEDVYFLYKVMLTKSFVDGKITESQYLNCDFGSGESEFKIDIVNCVGVTISNDIRTIQKCWSTATLSTKYGQISYTTEAKVVDNVIYEENIILPDNIVEIFKTPLLEILNMDNADSYNNDRLLFAQNNQPKKSTTKNAHVEITQKVVQL